MYNFDIINETNENISELEDLRKFVEFAIKQNM